MIGRRRIRTITFDIKDVHKIELEDVYSTADVFFQADQVDERVFRNIRHRPGGRLARLCWWRKRPSSHAYAEEHLR